jgi:hypothetical protein
MFAGSVMAQTPIPPQKPIVLMTEIGEVAAARDKARVCVAATVTPKQITCIVQIKDESMMGGTFDVDPKDIPQLSKLLQDASDKLLAGQTFSGKAGKASVTVVESDGQKFVVVKFESEGITFASDELTVDADNTAGLARILSRAKQVSDWLAPKLTALQAN